jgi:hypothetical protein
MLLKATGSVPHGGSQVTPLGGIYYDVIKAWIEGGAKLDPSTPRVASIELVPHNPVVAREGMKQQMRALATYADGHVRDVTAEAFITSGNSDVASADGGGLVTALRRGEAPVLARFEGAYTATTLTVMGDRSGFVWVQPPVNNYIDELVHAKLQRTKTLPSALCTDAEFIRRIHLDLAGMPPTSDQVRAFLADERESWLKRSELVDQLVGSPAFIEHWTNKWADLLQVNSKFLGAEGARTFRDWIRGQVEKNTPYDQFVYTILTAGGSNRENPPASYYKILREPTAIMENTTHLFLATRFNCNKCHDHPFERWTQDQYYELSAYFARVALSADPQSGNQRIGGTAVEGSKPLYELVSDQDNGEVQHLRTGQTAAPKFPYEHEFPHAESASRRQQLADWLTAKTNRYFALSFVNRMWGYLLGRGIIEPIDDLRAGNPASNPELLQRLTQQFIESGFDVRDLIRTICKSRTYQLSVVTNKWNDDDTTNYSHATARRLPAEVLYDALHQVTGSVSRIPGVPPGTRAAELPDVGVTLKSGFLEQFGRPPRESACECERTSDVMLGQVMALINGPTVADAIADPDNALAKLAAGEPDDRKLISEIFVRILNREAAPEEMDAGLKAISAAEEDQQRLVALHQERSSALEQYRQTLPEKIAAWEATQLPPEWFPLDLIEFAATNGAALTKEADGSWYLSGKNGKGEYTFKAQTALRDITAIRLEVLADPRLPKSGPGRSGEGNFVLSELSLQAAPQTSPDQNMAVALQNAQATFSQENFAVAKAIDGNLENLGWAVASQTGKDHTAVFETKENIGHEEGTILSFSLHQSYGDGSATIGRLRLAATTAPRPVRLVIPPQDLLIVLKTPVDKRTDEHKATLLAHYRQADAKLRELEHAVGESQRLQANRRVLGAQDIAWALINSPAFLFNR